MLILHEEFAWLNLTPRPVCDVWVKIPHSDVKRGHYTVTPSKIVHNWTENKNQGENCNRRSILAVQHLKQSPVFRSSLGLNDFSRIKCLVMVALHSIVSWFIVYWFQAAFDCFLNGKLCSINLNCRCCIFKATSISYLRAAFCF